MSSTLSEGRLAAGSALPTSLAARLSSASLWRPRHYLLLLAVGVLVAIRRAESALDTDVLWSSRFGMDLLSSGRLDRFDTFSWTAHGSRWIPSSWAWNVVLGGAYDGAGVFGLWTVAIALAGLFSLLLGAVAARAGARPVPTAMVFVALGFVVFVVVPRAAAVTNTIILAFALLVPVLVTGGKRVARRAGAALVAVEIVWMNLHSMAVLGPLLVFVVGVAVVLGSRLRGAELRRASTRIAVVVTLTAVGMAATPYGLEPLLHAQAVRDASVGLINEWQKPGFGSFAQTFAVGVIVACIPLAWHAWIGRRFALAAMLLLFALATMSAIRFAPMGVTVAIPELAILLGGLAVRPMMFRRTLIAGCSVFIGVTALSFSHFARLSDGEASPSLVHMVPPMCRVVNDYALGGGLMLLRPDVQVSLDGRNDMYGRARVLSAAALLNGGPAALRTMSASGVDCVLAPTATALVQQLKQDANWERIGQDSVRTLLVRKGTRS